MRWKCKGVDSWVASLGFVFFPWKPPGLSGLEFCLLSFTSWFPSFSQRSNGKKKKKVEKCIQPNRLKLFPLLSSDAFQVIKLLVVLAYTPDTETELVA